MGGRVPRQRPHVVQERPDAALPDGARLEGLLGKVHRPAGVAAAVVLDGGPVVGLDQARVQALVAVELDEALGVRGRRCGGGRGRRSVLVEDGPQGLDLGDARVGLLDRGSRGGAERAGALEAPVEEERGLAARVGLEGAFAREEGCY